MRLFLDTVEGLGWFRVLVRCIYPMYVPEQRRQLVADAISRFNYATSFGNFELDMQDGELRNRTSLESDCRIGDLMIDRAISKALDLADQYQAPLLAIAFGNASASDVLDRACRSADVTLQ